MLDVDVDVLARTFIWGRSVFSMLWIIDRGTRREYSSKPLKHSVVERILVFKR